MNPDPRLHGYTLSNDPLPEKLRPALNCYAARLDRRISQIECQQETIYGQILDRRAQLEALEMRLALSHGLTIGYRYKGKLIVNSLPSEVRQGPMLRELLRNCSSIGAIAIRRFSDLDPMNDVAEHEDKDENGTLLYPFLISTSLSYIRCREKGTESTFWSWAENTQRYLRPGQELEVEAPKCFASSIFLQYSTPAIGFSGRLVLYHSYSYQETAPFRLDATTS
ncbi:hypothetical protein BKA70DRAFT_1450240 [Coprinopsis sp. MPI-PUGE-AT-0042]|nr:hypothetical protein BKA70DRAFT_1450240 [Coprinopsis sp. MPI-PUGE-AT-0042]